MTGYCLSRSSPRREGMFDFKTKKGFLAAWRYLARSNIVVVLLLGSDGNPSGSRGGASPLQAAHNSVENNHSDDDDDINGFESEHRVE